MSGTVQNIELGRQGKSAFSLDAWYGVEYDITSPATGLTRIGRADLIASQPIYNRFRTRVKRNDRTTVYTLSNSNHLYKEDGNIANLSGVDGQVITDMPAHYRRIDVIGNIVRIKQSEYPLSGFSLVKKYGFGKYLASVDSEGKLASVSGVFPTVNLACDMSSTSGFGKRATNRGAGWAPVKWSAWNDLLMCELVYTANFNSQYSIGTGITDANSTDWAARNYGAVKINGNSNTFGSFTGSAPIIVNNWFKGSTTGLATNKCISTGRFASWQTSFVGMTIRNEANSLTATIVSKDNNDQITLSADIFTAASQQFTIVNSSYSTQSSCFAGIEDFFGHLWQWTAGILIDVSNYGIPEQLNKAYITQLHSQLADTITANYIYIGNIATTAGYITRMLPAYQLPVAVGGSSVTYMSDYYSAPTSSGLRLVFCGGTAINGSNAGSRNVYASYAPGAAYSHFGSRLGLEYPENEQDDL
jgi:hypothetical protein